MEDLAVPTRRTMRNSLRVIAAAVGAALLLVGAAMPAWAADNMTLTFVRHGQSEGNATGGTADDDPPLTALGQQQAKDAADRLAGNGYDAIYASSLVRTQQTAQPLADKLGKPVVVLPGLREVESGVLAGTPESVAGIGILAVGLSWMLGNRSVGVPGSVDGNEFDARMDGAIQTIYDSGSRNPAVFSHGAAIMFWTMMNVDNPDLGLIFSHPLDNTNTVVIEGNPEDGWTLANWNGVEVAKDPSLGTKLFVDFRDLAVAPQTAFYNVGKAFQTGDAAALASAVRDGVTDVARTTLNFVPKVVNDIVSSVGGSTATQLDQPATSNVAKTLKAAAQTDGDNAAVETRQTAPTPSIQTRSLLSAPAKNPAKDPAPTPAVATDKTTGAVELKDTVKPETVKPKTVSPNRAAAGVRDQVRSSIKKTGDAVRKATVKSHDNTTHRAKAHTGHGSDN